MTPLPKEAARPRASRPKDAPRRATVLVMLSLTALLGCGGGDGVSPPTKGSLAVTVAGLPAGNGASILVAGPSGYSHTLTGSGSLQALTPGSYTITAAQITVGGLAYAGAPVTQSVSVTAGTSPATAAVTYAMITGSLALSITGLPDGADAGVTITGPAGFSRTVTSSSALAGLVPGTYAIAAMAVQASGQTFAPAAPQTTVEVAPGGSGSSAVVTYAISTGGIAVTIAGLPSGATAGVTLSGPSGFSRAFAASDTVTNLPPGTYVATASAVTAGADAYSAAPTSQSVVVAASMTPSPVTVTYSVTTGKLAVVVAGLPSGANAAITVTGPAGFSALATATHTFTGLHPGTYTISAAAVVDGADTYAAAPGTQSAAVAASLSASTANVSYVAAAASLALTVSGLPGALPASIVVTGPGGFRRDVTTSTTLSSLVKGTYTITAQSVTQGSTTYLPGAPVQSVPLSAGANGSATVAYTGTTGALNLVIDRFYLVQSVQTYTSLVPLVANRNALIRVFPRATATNSATPSVRVRVYNGATLLKTVTIPAAGSSVPQAVDQAQISKSWNAVIEGGLLQPGVSILVDVDPTNAIAEASESDNMYPSSGVPLPLDVRAVSPVDLTLVPVTQAANSLTGDVTVANLAQFTNTLRKLYPLGAVNATVHANYTTNAPVLQNDDANSAWDQILNEISALRASDASLAYYYGVVKTTYTSGIAGLGFVPGHAAIGWDHLPSGDNVLAHELGHNFSLFHAPCGGAAGADPQYPYAGGLTGVYGYDVVSGVLKLPTQTDIMGYCANTWISDYHYTRVLTYRSTHPSVATVTAPARPGLLVWGRFEHGRPVLEPAYEVIAPPSLPVRQGTHRLELIGDRGEQITELVFDGDQVADSRTTDARMFAFVIPADALAGHTLAGLRLKAPGGQAELRDDARPFGVRRPLIRDASEEPQATAAGRGMVRLRWTASAVRGVLVRDPRTGEILTFGRGGEALVRSASRDLDVALSNGVRTERRRITVR